VAFSVTEASHVNTFLRWFLNEPRCMTVPTDDQARLALVALAGAASRRLMAGFTPTEVEGLWPDRRPVLVPASEKPKPAPVGVNPKPRKARP
jgi:hypothetical protein